jgi:ABC-type molybdate transport system permease subunit
LSLLGFAILFVFAMQAFLNVVMSGIFILHLDFEWQKALHYVLK